MGQSGLQEFQVITLRHGLLLCGLERKCAGAGGSQWKSSEAVEDVRKWVEDREGVGRGVGGLGEVREVQKRSGRLWESAEEVERRGK